jgi:hypothetical protein
MVSLLVYPLHSISQTTLIEHLTGHRVLLDDGFLELKVLERYDKDNLLTEVVVGGYSSPLTPNNLVILIILLQKTWREEGN